MAGETDPRGRIDPAVLASVPLFVATDAPRIGETLKISLPKNDALYELESRSIRTRRTNANGKFDEIRRKYGRYREVEGAAREWDKAILGIDRVLESSDSLGEDATHLDYQTLVLLQAGASINAQDKLKAMQKVFAEQAEPIDDFVQIVDFTYNQPFNLKIEGISIRQIHDQDRRKGTQLPVSSLLRFFMTAREATYGQMPANFFEENNGPFEKEFPERTVSSLGFTETTATAMLNCAIGSDDPRFLSRARSLPASAPATKRLVEKTREFNTRFRKQLQTPDDPDFEATKQVIEYYMQGPSTLKNFLVHILGLSNTEPLQEIYRAAVKFAEEGKHEEFYGHVTDMLRGYTSAISDFADVYTVDDLEEVFHSDGTVFDRYVPTLQDLRQQMVGILRNKPGGTDKFEMTPDDLADIPWGGIIPPQEATLSFLPGKPMLFNLKLHYENSLEDETTEHANVYFEVDAKKGTFEWNFIEDPESEGMQEFHSAAMRVMAQTLGRLGTRFEADKAARVAARKTRTQGNGFAKAPAVVTPEVIKSSSAHRKQRERRDIGEALAESTIVEDQGIKRQIIIPDELEFFDGMNRTVREHKETILAAIKDFNDRGVGEFKMLSCKPGGRKYYVLRVNTGRKGVRVLLREVESANNEQGFVIEDIDKRENIFRKHGLQS